MTYDRYVYYIFAVLFIVYGLLELGRLWLFRHRGYKSLHFSYEIQLLILEVTKGRQQAEIRRKEIEDNWWKYHGSFRKYLIFIIIMGIILLIVGPFIPD